jgi:UDP-N-acetylmuramyl pentapeptide phosphotransferase/UDP-N-acetylglucosamine-1-phosphate transferase
VLILGAAFYGLWDDLLGGEERGFRGHLGALRRGRVTAGQLKITTAGLAALIFSMVLPLGLPGGALAFFLVLLSANGLNLLDRRPGRAVKAFFAGALPLACLAPREELWALLVPLLASVLALGPLDLGARGMLGDCGSNLLGAALGAGAVLALPVPAQALLLGGWIILHVYAEVGSISDLVERHRFLRLLDALGRWREKLS